jgi:hypothetical protein
MKDRIDEEEQDTRVMNQLKDKREDLMNLKKRINDMKSSTSEIMTGFKVFLKKNKTIKL